jgi:hypothetical protein
LRQWEKRTENSKQPKVKAEGESGIEQGAWSSEPCGSREVRGWRLAQSIEHNA